MSVDNAPYGTSIPNILKHMFENTPYEWHIIGDEDHIKKADTDDFLEFYQDYYNPNNAIISISGDFEIDTAKKYIQEFFSSVPKQKTKENDKFKVDFIEKEIVKEYKDKFADVPAVFLAYYAPSIKDENYSYDVLLNILSNGESSRLYKRFVTQDEKALLVFAQPLMFYEYGLTMFLAIPAENTEPSELVKLLDEELHKIFEDGITENELIKAKNNIESQFVSSKYMSLHNALLLAKYSAYYDNPDKINEDLKEYLSVTTNDVKKTARTIFDTKSRLILYYYPDVKK
jgi:zinc protease